jgi:molecular chaperone DnaK
MVKEAQSHAAEDQKRRELIDARNEADALAYSVEKTLNENHARLAAPERARIESAIAELRRTIAADDVQAIKRSIDDLQRASRALAELLYQAQPRQGAGQASPGPSTSEVAEGEVVDAEPVKTRNGM